MLFLFFAPLIAKLINITDSNFDSFSDKELLLVFKSPTCKSCLSFVPEFERFEDEAGSKYPTLNFGIVEVESNPSNLN